MRRDAPFGVLLRQQVCHTCATEERAEFALPVEAGTPFAPCLSEDLHAHYGRICDSSFFAAVVASCGDAATATTRRMVIMHLRVQLLFRVAVGVIARYSCQTCEDERDRA